MTAYKIEGYASLFEEQDLSGDTIVRGAFQRSLRQRAARNVKMLFQHDHHKPIGVWSDLYEDVNGLFVRGQINDNTQLGRECAALLAQGALTGLSIGFNTVKATTPKAGRRLLEVDLWEVSLVTFPMLPQAQARLTEVEGSLAGAVPALQNLTELMRV